MTPSDAIDRLRATGLTEQAIAQKVGARQSTINRIRHGVMQPTYAVGKALVDLAEELLDSRRTSAANDGGAASPNGTPLQPLKDAA